MGYLNDKTLIIALSLGIGITISGLSYLLIKRKKNKWKVNARLNPFIINGKDNITKWIDGIDKRLAKNGLKFKVKWVLIVNIVVSIIAFYMGMTIFKNLTASIFLAISFFIIPEYILYLYEDRKMKKIENQIIIAIRVFTSEFYKTKNIEKSMVEVANKVLNPVGGYFADAYADILMGYDIDSILGNLMIRVDNEYWKIFIQLIYQTKSDANVVNLFTDLITKIERSIELSRSNESSLGGERIVALVLSLLPIPSYLYMKTVIPETTVFITQTYTGRLLVTVSFLSIFIFITLDKVLRRVE